MTFIEGIGDEVVQFFVGLFIVIIVVLAWFTTNIPNHGTGTILFLTRRRSRAVRRFITHTESSTIVEGTIENSNSEANQTTPRIEEGKPTSTSTESGPLVEEETRIVETMDAPNNESTDLRRRTTVNTNSEESNNQPSNNDETCTNETYQKNAASHYSEHNVKPTSSRNEEKENDKIHVKLKYVTDEVRIVDATLRENIGTFKRRHFQTEYAANKIVKLIFNGRILERDGDTLQTCGLFNNCVVHCVFLNDTNMANEGASSGARSTHQGTISRATNTNQQNEWHLEHLLLSIMCCFLGAAWYMRYAYSHLYTVTATVGLFCLTGIFTFIMLLMHSSDVDINQQTENVQRRQQ